jgi:hypothetical protein
VVDVRRSWFSQDFLVLLRGRRLFDIRIGLTSTMDKEFVSHKIDFLRHKGFCC